MILTCDNCRKVRPAASFPLGGSWCMDCVMKHQPVMAPERIKEKETVHQPMEEQIAPQYDPMGAVKEFHDTFGITRFIDQPDEFGRRSLVKTRLTIIAEEFREVQDELLDAMNGGGNWMNLAKELADLLYVVYGTADSLDIPLTKVFDAVHKSNMSKLGDDGKPIFRHDGKILKGPNYHEPDLTSVFGVSD